VFISDIFAVHSIENIPDLLYIIFLLMYVMTFILPELTKITLTQTEHFNSIILVITFTY
jgi:hypothetical protein